MNTDAGGAAPIILFSSVLCRWHMRHKSVCQRLHFTKNSVIVSSVDDINVEERFSWLDISVLALILQTRYLCVRFLVQRYDIFLARWEIVGNNGK